MSERKHGAFLRKHSSPSVIFGSETIGESEMQILGIYRETIFSPGRMSDDALILEATAAALRQRGLDVCLRRAEMLTDEELRFQVVFSMAQGEPILHMLQRWQDQGSVEPPAEERRLAPSNSLASTLQPHDTTLMSVRVGSSIQTPHC